MTTVLSLGGGWQSSALLLMSCAGQLPKLDAAVFADTQNEMPETYDYLAYLDVQCAAAGIRLVRGTAGDLFADVEAKQGQGMQPSLPVRVRDADGALQRVNGYTCSYDYKRRVVTREVRRLCGPRGAWKQANVVQWIGYSMDEMSRMKQDDECRCGHKRAPHTGKRNKKPQGHEWGGGCRQCGCTSYDPWRVNDWPLIQQLRMTRRDCHRWILANGHPPPPRSACIQCPNRGNEHWRYLRAERPELWARAVHADQVVRHGLNGLNGAAFIHQSGVPLEDADLRSRVQVLDEDEGQAPLFADEDGDCDAGVCFT